MNTQRDTVEEIQKKIREEQEKLKTASFEEQELILKDIIQLLDKRKGLVNAK